MKQRTVVQWLEDRLPSLFEHDESGFYKKLFDEARLIHNEDIINAYATGVEMANEFDEGDTELKEAILKQIFKS